MRARAGNFRVFVGGPSGVCEVNTESLAHMVTQKLNATPGPVSAVPSLPRKVRLFIEVPSTVGWPAEHEVKVSRVLVTGDHGTGNF